MLSMDVSSSCFFAQKYVPLKPNDASKLAKLVLDSDDKYTLKTGQSLDLGSGYTLQAKQVDVTVRRSGSNLRRMDSMWMTR